ncbi:MAG TPA: hypothetical protein VFW04_10160 [Gemmatimonadaceae bacterium]|nr:hypothetical protein [Gemmatimonadaceae bacterium]
MAMPLNELEILVARCGHDVVAFGLATTLCRNLGFSCRLLVGLEPRAEEQWVEIAAGSADLTIGIRDPDRSVRWLGQPERLSEDTLAWTLPDRGAQPVSWLEIASETRRVRVRLADAALALLSQHGWREAIDDSVAEPVLWVADLLEGIAELLTGIAPTSNGSNRWPHDRQLRSSRALDSIRTVLGTRQDRC